MWAYKVVMLQLDVAIGRHEARRAGAKPEYDSIADLLNRYGREGWEMTAAINHAELGIIAFLKRRFTPDDAE